MYMHNLFLDEISTNFYYFFTFCTIENSFENISYDRLMEY